MPTENLEGTRAGLQLMISWGSGGRGELRIDWINPNTRRNTNRTLFGVTESVYAQLRPLLLAAFDAPPTRRGTYQAENAGCPINSNLWLNEYDPDLDAIARYTDPSHEACEGMGIVRECGEWAFCSCTEAALLAAAEEPAFASVVRLLSPQRGCRQVTEFFTREKKPLLKLCGVGMPLIS